MYWISSVLAIHRLCRHDGRRSRPICCQWFSRYYVDIDGRNQTMEVLKCRLLKNCDTLRLAKTPVCTTQRVETQQAPLQWMELFSGAGNQVSDSEQGKIYLISLQSTEELRTPISHAMCINFTVILELTAKRESQIMFLWSMAKCLFCFFATVARAVAMAQMATSFKL